MPIYEFYCSDCNTIFNFFARSANTNKKPKCPKCKVKTLERQMSVFSFTGNAKEGGDMDDLPIDERKMEKAMQQVAKGNLDSRIEVVSNDEIGALGEGFNSMIGSLKESESIKESFGKYISEEVRDEILSGRVPLDGEMKRATLLFSDLRDFTPFVESTHPKQVVAIMNQYFNEMTRAVKMHKGLILQYVGDEIEAVFGVPINLEAHPDLAVQAAGKLLAANLDDAAQRKLVEEYLTDLETPGETGAPPS